MSINVKQVIDMSLVGITSTKTGQVHVIIVCSLLGHIIGQVEILSDSKFKYGIWKVENLKEFEALESSMMEALLQALKRIVESSVNHCMANPDHWLITELETNYDFLVAKATLDKEALELYEGMNLKPRYPLFGLPKRH